MMAAPRTTFIDAALGGTVLDIDTAVDDAIEEWHRRDGRLDDGSQVPIHDWLGMTREEYARFLEHPAALRTILHARTFSYHPPC